MLQIQLAMYPANREGSLYCGKYDLTYLYTFISNQIITYHKLICSYMQYVLFT
jgi:hypothetical protein